MWKFKAFFTKEKLHAFSIHLGISLIIFFALLYFIVFEWYPEPLFKTDGGWQGIRLIAFVDIVLGPVLTLIIFKKGKRGLKLDLVIIAIVQMTALISGTIVIYNEHPVAIIIVNNRLHPVTAYQVAEARISYADLQRYSALKPPLIYSNIPKDDDEYRALLLDSLQTGRGIRLYGEYYKKWTSEIKNSVSQNSMSMEKFLVGKPKEQMVYNKFVSNNKSKVRNFIYLPLYSRYKYSIAVIDKHTFSIVTVLDINPPESRQDFATR